MHVKNVWIENAVLQANEGIDIQEASGITLNNITMVSKNTNPVNYVLNSDNITINHLKYKDSTELLLQVQGERSKEIKLLNTNTALAKQKLVTDFGATNTMVSWDETKTSGPTISTSEGKEEKIKAPSDSPEGGKSNAGLSNFRRMKNGDGSKWICRVWFNYYS
jgi:hypothetical protein